MDAPSKIKIGKSPNVALIKWWRRELMWQQNSQSCFIRYDYWVLACWEESCFNGLSIYIWDCHVLFKMLNSIEKVRLLSWRSFQVRINNINLLRVLYSISKITKKIALLKRYISDPFTAQQQKAFGQLPRNNAIGLSLRWKDQVKSPNTQPHRRSKDISKI